MKSKIIKIERADAIKLIKESNGKIISVRFIKRSDGKLREMVCRIGVTSHRADPENPKPAYDFDAHGLIPVFDMQKNAYRTIPTESIVYLKMDRKEYKVIEEKMKSVKGDAIN